GQPGDRSRARPVRRDAGRRGLPVAGPERSLRDAVARVRRTGHRPLPVPRDHADRQPCLRRDQPAGPDPAPDRVHEAMPTKGSTMLASLLAHDRRPRGQIIVIVALAMVAMLAAVALIIDGGNAYAQQRKTQNGIDASAEAGATQLARIMVGVGIGDAEVRAAI